MYHLGDDKQEADSDTECPIIALQTNEDEEIPPDITYPKETSLTPYGISEIDE